MIETVDITIIGRGVVGLAVGAAAAGLGRNIYLLSNMVRSMVREIN